MILRKFLRVSRFGAMPICKGGSSRPTMNGEAIERVGSENPPDVLVVVCAV